MQIYIGHSFSNNLNVKKHSHIVGLCGLTYILSEYGIIWFSNLSYSALK